MFKIIFFTILGGYLTMVMTSIVYQKGVVERESTDTRRARALARSKKKVW